MEMSEDILADILQQLTTVVPTVQRKTFDAGLISDAFGDLEKLGLSAAYLLVHKSMRPFLLSWGYVAGGAYIWGVRILYSNEVPESTGYVLSDSGTTVCFTWDHTPDPPDDVPEFEDPPLQETQVSRCPHCGKGILVALLKEEP